MQTFELGGGARIEGESARIESCDARFEGRGARIGDCGARFEVGSARIGDLSARIGAGGGAIWSEHGATLKIDDRFDENMERF